MVLSIRCRVCRPFSLLHSAAVFILFITFLCSPWNISGQSSFRSLRRQTNGWWPIHGDTPYQSAVTLQASANLTNWTELAVLHPRTVSFSTNPSPFIYMDPESTNKSQRFYD